MVGRPPAFRGRDRERATLDEMLNRVRAGESAALVLRGEAGIGKTALLHYCARQASGCRVAEVSGVESEFEMPFAILHQLCSPLLGHLDDLPEPQQQALRVAFGLTAGPTPDRFVVGLAVLGLLAETAAERPLVCLVDDAHWLDEPSRQVLGFVARRLRAEAVLLLFAVRETSEDSLLGALPTLSVQGLEDGDARALLASAVPGHLDEHVRDTLIAETRGNPLGLLELPREMSPAMLAGGFGIPSAAYRSRGLGEHYARRIAMLPEPAQRFMLLAAADPTGDATLLWRAAATLGLDRGAAAAAESEQLLEIVSRVRFRHSLVRSAAYSTASDDDRRAAHLALAGATDPSVDSDRRVWHLAAAATGPDEAVASELVRMAGRAQERAGLAAAAAFLERSVQLTADSASRVERALAAARAHLHAGANDAALRLLAEARGLATDDVQPAKIERLRGQVEYAFKPGAESSIVLVEAAKRLEPLDAGLASETYLEAWFASMAAGPYARPGGRLSEISEEVRRRSSESPESLPELFLDGFVAAVTVGRAASVPSLRAALDTFLGDDLPVGDWLQWGHCATSAACVLWDWRSWERLSVKHVEFARLSGALAPLSLGLNGLSVVRAWFGELDAAATLVAEYDAVEDATGIGWFPGDLVLAAYRGRAEALGWMSAAAEASAEQGLGIGSQFATWTTAILCNSLGRYEDAFTAAHRASLEPELPVGTVWAMPELIEAATRTGRREVARETLDYLLEQILDESDWAGGIAARSRALVTEGEEAEHWYAEAVGRFARTPFRTEHARSSLVYGEWLRREGRRVDARAQLETAFELFSAMGAVAFAERSRHELLATGAKVRKREVTTRHELTAQEEHIARLARDGRSNAEIGAELFLSVRTVEWHLRKVFQKLGVASRRDLREALPARDRTTADR